jgi:hypothetical protein
MDQLTRIAQATAGLKLIRVRPWLPLAWALAYTAMGLMIYLNVVTVISLLFGSAAGVRPVLAGVAAHRPDAIFKLVAAVLLLAPLVLLWTTVWNSTMFRAVLHPRQSAWAYMRLGADELRVAASYLTVALLLAASTLVAVTIWAGSMTALKAAVGSGRWIPVVVGLVLGLGLIAGLLWLAVRLSFVPVMSFNEGRLTVRKAFALTRGRFWGLLWIYFSAFAMMGAIGRATIFLGDVSGYGRVGNHSVTTSLLFFLVVLPLQILLGTLQLAIGGSVSAAAYQAIVPTESEAEVFS